jgi:splicing factor 3B subunit 2
MKNRLGIAELKQLVARPDVVEIHDCNSIDPKLLVSLKSYRNSMSLSVFASALFYCNPPPTH